MKLVFGMEVGLSPGDFVLDGDPAPSLKGGGAPSTIFGPFLLWPNGWMHQDATWYGCGPQPMGLCVRWRPTPLPKKGAEPPNFCPCLLWPNGWTDQDGTWHGDRPWSSPHCAGWGHSSPPKKGAKRLDASMCHLVWWYGGRPQPRRLC